MSQQQYDKFHYPISDSVLTHHCFSCCRVLMCDPKMCTLAKECCDGYHIMNVPRALHFICGRGECSKFTFPSGREEKITACESLTLSILLENYDESDIMMNHRINKDFIASIYLPKERLIIESTTAGLLREETILNNKKKDAIFEALRSEGFIVEIWLFLLDGMQKINKLSDDEN